MDCRSRVIQLSGLWSPVYQAYLQAKILPEMGTQAGSGKRKPEKGRVIDGMDAIAPLATKGPEINECRKTLERYELKKPKHAVGLLEEMGSVPTIKLSSVVCEHRSRSNAIVR